MRMFVWEVTKNLRSLRSSKRVLCKLAGVMSVVTRASHEMTCLVVCHRTSHHITSHPTLESAPISAVCYRLSKTARQMLEASAKDASPKARFWTRERRRKKFARPHVHVPGAQSHARSSTFLPLSCLSFFSTTIIRPSAPISKHTAHTTYDARHRQHTSTANTHLHLRYQAAPRPHRDVPRPSSKESYKAPQRLPDSAQGLCIRPTRTL